MSPRFHDRIIIGEFDGGQGLDSKVHGANMGPTWVQSTPDEPCYQCVCVCVCVCVGGGGGGGFTATVEGTANWQ